MTITAHPSITSNGPGIIKFDNVTFVVGITNQSAYRRSGKFVCEKEGLYLISASIYSETNNAHYYIKLNGDIMSKTWIGYSSSPASLLQHTGTVVLALQLRPKDSVWVYCNGKFNIQAGLWSSLTIVKVR